VKYVKQLHQVTDKKFLKAKPLGDHIQSTLRRVNSPILQQTLQTLELTQPLNDLCSCEANSTHEALIHGDLYPNNILIEEGNRVCFIDWTDAGIGDPFVDIACHAMFYPLKEQDKLLGYYFDNVDKIMQQKLLCYYCLRLFKVAVWGVEEAKKAAVKNPEQLLTDLLKQQNYSEPYDLVFKIFTGNMSYRDPKNFLLVTATILKFLDKFTKTPEFTAAIKSLGKTAAPPTLEPVIKL
jgi:thiamine kinase-like enzyme